MLKISRQWLNANGFPISAVLRWRGAELLDELKESGIRLYAIIGSPAVVADASGYIEKRFSFSEADDAVAVKDWKDVTERLK